MLTIEEPERLRAIADATRGRIVTLLNQRAASTTELAAALEMPKGTVGHHLKVLEKAELVRVVRTRQVRALTEKYYGRVARLFVLKSADESVAGGPPRRRDRRDDAPRRAQTRCSPRARRRKRSRGSCAPASRRRT